MLPKRKLEQQGVMPLPKKNVIQSSVELTECRTTKPESSGKTVFACRTSRCQDNRVSQLNTFFKFLQPSAVLAACSGKGTPLILGLRHAPPVFCTAIDFHITVIATHDNTDSRMSMLLRLQSRTSRTMKSISQPCGILKPPTTLHWS
jgi:hypothetical protein